MSVKGRVRIRFDETCVAARGRLLLELDEEANSGRSHFEPGVDDAYVRLFPSGLYPELRTNVGVAQIVAVGLPLEIEDYFTVANTDTLSLSRPVNLQAPIQWQWVGRVFTESGKTPQPQISEWEIRFAEPVSGVLWLKYQSLFDRIKVNCNEETDVLLEAFKTLEGYEEPLYAYIVISWEHVERTVYLTVKCACTRAPLQGVAVYVDGEYRGLTDVSGRITLGDLRVGSHSLRLVKEGYQASDVDLIKNDELVVPEQ